MVTVTKCSERQVLTAYDLNIWYLQQGMADTRTVEVQRQCI